MDLVLDGPRFHGPTGLHGHALGHVRADTPENGPGRIRGRRPGKGLGRVAADAEEEQQEREALEKQLVELAKQIEGLTIRAPISGYVVSRRLNALEGMYIAQGDPVLTLGDERRKQVRFSIAQEALPEFRAVVGKTVSVSIPSVGQFPCCLNKIEPRASRTPDHPALCAPYGGPLVVQRTADEQFDGDVDPSTLQLLTPHFIGAAALLPHQSSTVRSGQRATVELTEHRRSIGAHMVSQIGQWLRSRTTASST